MCGAQWFLVCWVRELVDNVVGVAFCSIMGLYWKKCLLKSKCLDARTLAISCIRPKAWRIVFLLSSILSDQACNPDDLVLLQVRDGATGDVAVANDGLKLEIEISLDTCQKLWDILRAKASHACSKHDHVWCQPQHSQLCCRLGRLLISWHKWTLAALCPIGRMQLPNICHLCHNMYALWQPK